MTRPWLVSIAGAALLLFAACDGTIGNPEATPDGGVNPPLNPSAPDPCLSDPDLPGSVVCDAGTEWTCLAEGGQIVCEKADYDVPGGSSADWECEDQGEFVVCTSTSDDVPHNNPGWECAFNEEGKWECISLTPDEPERGGPWECVYDDVSGVTCTSTDTGAWGCYQDGTATICHKDRADAPNDEGGWTCVSEAGGVTCHTDTPGESADYPGWTCTSDSSGTTCFRPTPDEPDFGGPWECEYDDVSGITCISDDAAGWDCVPDGNGNTICTNDSPATPDEGSWDCYDADGTTICIGDGDVPDGGDWTCWTDDVGRTRCEHTPEYPGDTSGSGEWTCWFDDVGNRVCSDAPPDGSGSVCVPGVKRWCDGYTYCSWGQQTCLPNGTWGECYENPGIRPNTLCACYFFFYNTDCCETPDCIIPPGTNGQECPPSSGQLCDYCTTSADCQNGARCIYTNTGESYCGQDCSTEGCPSGYECRTVTDQGGTSYRQCVPNDLSCYF